MPASSNSIRIISKPYQLRFRFPFRIAHGMRTTTDVVYIKAEYEGFCGYGEAALPPYLPDTVSDTLNFFEDPFFQSLNFPLAPAEISAEVNRRFPGNFPAKAALDMALWQLKARTENKTLAASIGVNTEQEVPHFYTLGVGDKKEMATKITHGLMDGFSFFKLKLDGIEDQRVLDDFGLLCSKPFAVDANQAWKNLDQAIILSRELENRDCMLIEQPFEKSDSRWTRTLREELKIPVLADESCQGLEDIPRLSDVFDGINIKLQKCGGITGALSMIHSAREHGLKILLGCMSESSVGCGAAETLAPLCDWADLDGPWLIGNDPEITELFK